MRDAVLICTRNRPDDLRRTLRSIARQNDALGLCVLVVDGSDAGDRELNRRLIDEFSTLSIRHLPYPHAPSLAGQRNYGIDHLPKDIEVVHFLDDDVTVLPGYFAHLADTLEAHPEVGGVGGHVLEPNKTAPTRPSLFRRLFLLDGPSGHVLPSGHVAPAQTHPPRRSFPSQWLNGCASYRCTAFGNARFDEALTGYTTYDDVDFSYRLGRQRPLLIEPKARLVHHCSPTNRFDAERYACTSTIKQYWFMEKNLQHPLRKPAFWWSVLGQLLARLISRKPERNASLRGLMRGIRTVLRRDHPLLRNDTGSA